MYANTMVLLKLQGPMHEVEAEDEAALLWQYVTHNRGVTPADSLALTQHTASHRTCI